MVLGCLLSFSDSILVIVGLEDIEFSVAATLLPFCSGTWLAGLFCDIATLF